MCPLQMNIASLKFVHAVADVLRKALAVAFLHEERLILARFRHVRHIT